MLLKLFTLAVFGLLGWKVKGSFPPVKKCVLVGAPHTTNLDFILGMATFYKLKIPIRYLIKKDWVNVFGLGRVMKASGAIGVDRSVRKNLVDMMADLLKSEDRIALVVTPEGTRKLVRKWKTGFYYAALKANVPLVLSSLDYGKKETEIGPCIMPSGDFKKDMDLIREFYRDKKPRYPEKFSLDIYLPEETATEKVCQAL